MVFVWANAFDDLPLRVGWDRCKRIESVVFLVAIPSGRTRKVSSGDGPLVCVGLLGMVGGSGFGKPGIDGNDVHSTLVVDVEGAPSNS